MQVIMEFNQLFDALVPAQGKAGTLGGELLRATARLGYRYLNDGDMVGRDYGNETCNAAARFIDECVDQDTSIPGIIDSLWCSYDPMYGQQIEALVNEMVIYIKERPWLVTEPCTFDFWDWAKPEDCDYDEEEEEW